MASFTITIPDFHPARLNQWDGRHWAVRARVKRLDREIVWAACHAAGVTLPGSKRRVSLQIILGPRQRGGDPDCWWKSTLDALVSCQALRDDSRHWCELGTVTYNRGPRKATVITLEDVD